MINLVVHKGTTFRVETHLSINFHALAVSCLAFRKSAQPLADAMSQSAVQ